MQRRNRQRDVAFVKAESLGNDFVIVAGGAGRDRWTGRRARAICDRRLGIGSDGLVILRARRDRRFQTLMFNADGSRFEWSGNGLRCAAAYLSHQYPTRTMFAFETDAGRIAVQTKRRSTGSVTACFTRPNPDVVRQSSRARSLPRGVAGPWRVDAGNPQLVFVVRNFKFDWIDLGSDCQRRARRTGGVNVAFVRVVNSRSMEMRVYERGAGPTPGSGSGALAALAVCVREGLVGRRVAISSPGGLQRGVIDPLGETINLSAPARIVYEGIWKG